MLRKLQKDFAAAVFDGQMDELEKEIRNEGIPPAELIEVYRNNSFSVQTSALRLTYPAVARILGEETFNAIARAYLRKHHSRSGNLDDFGGQFPEFLKGAEDIKTIKFLPELAMLELLYQESLLADKGKDFDGGKLAGLAPEKFFDLRFEFAPHVRMIQTGFAISPIWNGGEGKPIAKSENILVAKTYLKPDIFILSDAEYSFLKILKEGGTLYEAFDNATEADENFSFENCLKENIIRKVFTDLKGGL